VKVRVVPGLPITLLDGVIDAESILSGSKFANFPAELDSLRTLAEVERVAVLPFIVLVEYGF
jgi:hypothetical protein